jgi:hypothetical protein
MIAKPICIKGTGSKFGGCVRKVVELTSGDLPVVRKSGPRIERLVLTGRQKKQLELAFMEEGRSEAPTGSREGTETSAGKRGTESPAIAEQWMEEVCGRENCKQALKRVKANTGSAGVDGMTVQQLPEYLKQHWPVIRGTVVERDV